MNAIQLYVCSYHGKVILQSIAISFFFFFLEGIGFKSCISNVEHIGIKRKKGPQTKVPVNQIAISCHSWETF